MGTDRYRIGFITLEAINAYTTQLWLGVNDCATHLGLNLITYGGFQKVVSMPILDGNTIDSHFNDPIRRLIDVRALDGVIVWTAGILQDHTCAREFLAQFQSIPTVSIGVDIEGVDRVLVDGYQGMASLVTHVITTCGRRNIAFITGTPSNLDAQNRRKAYEDTLQKYGLPVREEYIVPGAFAWNSREIGKLAMSELFDHRQLHPDAVVAASDELAIGAMEFAHQRGIRVPEEMSITGFDDIPDCISVYPTLTTVSQNTYELAWNSVEMLLARLQRKPTTDRVVIPTRVVLRQSCGVHSTKTTQRVCRNQEENTTDAQGKSDRKIAQTLVEYLTVEKENFQAIFEEAVLSLSKEKLDEIYAHFTWFILLAEPSHFINMMQSLVYEQKDRNVLEKCMNHLLAFMRRIENEIATFYAKDVKSYSGGDFTTCMDLMITKIELLFEQALSSMDRDRHARTQYQLAQLQMVNRNLLIPYDPERLTEIFAQQLPRLGIDLAYVALFTNFDQPTDEVRLIVAYDRQKNLAEAPRERYYKVTELSSGLAVLQDRLMNLVVIPIYSTNIYAGFVLFSFGPRNYQFYTQLGSTLAYNIVNSTLLAQLRNHANQLEERITERTADLVVANERLQSEIGERIRVEQELEAARDRALEVSRLKSEFLATMSHEIRTPMNGILGMTELLLDSELDEEQRSYAGVTYEEGLKLLEIINSILDFSKIEAGKLELEEVEFALTSEIQNVIKLFNNKAKSKGLTLLSATAPNVPEQIISDPVRIGQILRNLIGNAIKFTESGEVFVTVQCDPNLSSTCSASGEQIELPLQITVRDTGIGMTRETIEDLFTPFSQADSSTTRRYGGTGLGLAITKRLVELLGGRISVESEPNVGSTFVVRFNCRCRNEVYRAAVQRAMPTTPQYLLVSSDVALCRLLTNYLETWAIRATSFSSAESNNIGLLLHLYQVIAQNNHYSGIIIDQQNSMIEPATFARSIRADPLLKHSHLLLISPNQTASFRHLLQDAGFEGILHPPVTQSALHQHISHLLPKAYGALSGIEETQTVQVATATTGEPGNLILLVEDYVNNQRVALAYLRKLGYAAHVVEDGQAAVDAIINHGHLYQLVLMDWHLPVMDGLQATESIREHEKLSNKHIPIIGMTANALKGDRERCIAAGMDDYISKPMQRDELGQVLSRWFPQSS